MVAEGPRPAAVILTCDDAPLQQSTSGLGGRCGEGKQPLEGEGRDDSDDDVHHHQCRHGAPAEAGSVSETHDDVGDQAHDQHDRDEEPQQQPWRRRTGADECPADGAEGYPENGEGCVGTKAEGLEVI